MGLSTNTSTVDLSHKPEPTIIRKMTNWAGKTIVDKNTDRPTFIIEQGGSLLADKFVKPTSQEHARPTDPGLGKWFDGTFMPKLKIGFSHHDFARSLAVIMGTGFLRIAEVEGDVPVLMTAAPDGTYGDGSKVSISYMKGFRLGVAFTGQKNLDLYVMHANMAIRAYQDAEVGGGHVFYGNESWLYDDAGNRQKYLAAEDVEINIQKIEGHAGSPFTLPLRVNEWSSAKFKGTRRVNYRCLHDCNPCGALNVIGATGRADIKLWEHPGTDIQNKQFLAFRFTDIQPEWGKQMGNFSLSGVFDPRLARDQTVKDALVHCRNGDYAHPTEVTIKTLPKSLEEIDQYGGFGNTFTARGVTYIRE